MLHIGCNGPLHKMIKKVAEKLYGIDRVVVDGENIQIVDVEKDDFMLPDDANLYVCAEILEHLSNPGAFLDKIRGHAPVLFTVPNAFCSIGQNWTNKKYENVNSEHVCYYSYKTMKTLLERHGYTIDGFWWAGSKPYTSESLVFMAR